MAPKKRQVYRHLPAFILLLLAEGDSYGGAIHAALTERLSEFKGGSAAIYRSLQKLGRTVKLKHCGIRLVRDRREVFFTNVQQNQSPAKILEQF